MASSDEEPRPLAVVKLSRSDNVAVALRPLKAGETVVLDGSMLTIDRNVATGLKLAARPIAKGEVIVKYGSPIGIAIADIAAGEYLHMQNVETDYYATRSPED